MNLTYHGHEQEIDELELDQCTTRWTGDGFKRWLMLWFRVARDSDGVADTFAVPIAPEGPPNETGTGGRTWGFTHTAAGVWQVAPSINVLVTRELHPGEHPTEASLWHQTPAVVGVPEPAPW